jgi:hypothetical protein
VGFPPSLLECFSPFLLRTPLLPAPRIADMQLSTLARMSCPHMLSETAGASVHVVADRAVYALLPRPLTPETLLPNVTLPLLFVGGRRTRKGRRNGGRHRVGTEGEEVKEESEVDATPTCRRCERYRVRSIYYWVEVLVDAMKSDGVRVVDRCTLVMHLHVNNTSRHCTV